MPTERIQYLAGRYFAGTCSEAEKEELLQWAGGEPGDKEIEDLLVNAWQHHEPVLQMPDDMSDRIIGSLFTPVRRMYILRRVAAAAILILSIAGAYYYFQRPKELLPVAKVKDNNFKNDVLPAAARATLTLANGRTIVLDSVGGGTLAQQGNAAITSNKGSLVYSTKGNQAEMLYNTLTTHRGELYQLTLSDGTKVWLNAASSIHFPVSFTGKERKVEITGEAYFEVANNVVMPFIVKKGDMEVQVLGTHFNINAYDNEAAMKITLLEGAVKVIQKAESKLLKPGEQAISSSHLPLAISHSPDIEQVMAWKNGLFDFKNTDIETLMREIERWYNVDIVYEGMKTKDSFSGGISRSATLTELLSILQMSKVHFRLEGKKLTVLP